MTAPHALSEEMPLPGDNPFVTRATRSGMLPFLFPAGESLGGLVDSLRLARWQGQIVGPRGSGKSTLLAALRPEIAGQVSEVVVARLFAAKRFLPPEIQSPPRFPGRPQGKRVFIRATFLLAALAVAAPVPARRRWAARERSPSCFRIAGDLPCAHYRTDRVAGGGLPDAAGRGPPDTR
jgi:hypothetical protein